MDVLMRLILGLLCLLAFGASSAHAVTPPASWPFTNVEVGVRDDEGAAATLKDKGTAGIRYHYLSGGANTGNGWQNWANGGGSFVSQYLDDSRRSGITPVFSYYQLFQSAPAHGGGDEKTAVLSNLNNASTMRAWLDDITVFFQKAGEFRDTPVVLHVEPDMWGYIQTGAGAATPVAAGLGNAAGLAKEVVKLRNRYAPNVLLGYHLSAWGTGIDIALSDPDPVRLDTAATSAVAYYRALGANFDLIFAEFTDRDAGYAQKTDGKGSDVIWESEDFARQVRFLSHVTAAIDRPAVLWQIPLGNTRMRAMDNNRFHFQDNKVEWLFGDPSRGNLAAYRDAGVIATLFGPAKDGATCACDAAKDGITNPGPINGNGAASLSDDDDGGFFAQQARAYRRGPLPLSGGSVASTGAPLATLRGRIKWGYVFRGGFQKIDASVRASRAAKVRLRATFSPLSRAGVVGKPVARLTRKIRVAPKTKKLNLRLLVPKRASAGRYALGLELLSADGKASLQELPNAAAFAVKR